MCVKKHIKHLTTFGGNIYNVLRNILMDVFRIIFNNDVQKMSFNYFEKSPNKMVPKCDYFAKKKCTMEKMYLMWLYVNDASITHKNVF